MLAELSASIRLDYCESAFAHYTLVLSGAQIRRSILKTGVLSASILLCKSQGHRRWSGALYHVR